jgi:cytochrome subunit of sulfide dehydrogenase
LPWTARQRQAVLQAFDLKKRLVYTPVSRSTEIPPRATNQITGRYDAMRMTEANKRRTRSLARAVVGALALAAAPLVLAADPSSCAGCHGQDGISQDPNIPTISGASEFFIENQLVLFQDEARPCVGDLFAQFDNAPASDHCALMADLSEADIEGLAAHYAEQPFKAASQSIDAGRAGAGAAIHDQSCERCHSAGGSDPEDDAGLLAGQWKPYLERALHDFREGRREQPAAMERAVQALSEADIEALAAYYASQGQ